MNVQLLQALGLASAGITVATTGAALLVIHIVLSPTRDGARDRRG